MVRIGARHVLRHDGHPVHQTSLRLRRCWRIVVVVVDGRRGWTVMMSNVVVVSLMVMMMMRCNRMLVIVIVVVLLMLLLLLSTGRSSADANGSLCRCRRSSSWSAIRTGLGDMRMSCFRRRRPDKRRFLQFSKLELIIYLFLFISFFRLTRFYILYFNSRRNDKLFPFQLLQWPPCEIIRWNAGPKNAHDRIRWLRCNNRNLGELKKCRDL